MKKIIITLVLLFGILSTNAQTIPKESYAETISYLIKAGENNFDDLYDGVVPVNRPFTETNFVNVLTGIMDSSYSYLISISNNYPNYATSQFRINYIETTRYKKGVKTDKIKEETADYFELLAQQPGYKITNEKTFLVYKKNKYLYKNNILLASYHDKKDNSIAQFRSNCEGEFTLIFYEQPRTKIFADESSFKGVFPSTIIATTAPQVWESKTVKNGKELISHWNGIFTSGGVLKVGNKTYHGYGPLYDGVWFSENWEYSNVTFIPEGTTDVICGIFKSETIDMQYFNTIDNFIDKFKDQPVDGQPQKYSFVTNYNCNWVKNIFTPYKIPCDAALQVIQDKRNAEIDISNAKYHKEHPEAVQEAKKTGVFTSCHFCNGSGKVVNNVTTTSSYQATSYKTCPKCGGKGMWMEY